MNPLALVPVLLRVFAALATPSPGPDAVVLPGACAPIPEPAYGARPDGDTDLDRDGVPDVFSATDCADLGCNYQLYVRRGLCGHAVGALFVPWKSQLLAHASHGLRDLRVQAYELDDTMLEPPSQIITYRFDGTSYQAVAHTGVPGKR